ncbi:MAG TPA: capsule biosynthesis protein, partial [Paracoccus sp. (in: a-proteobacteria)]|nr:capsule biosynthesis protein [Paracoccus sp. (in: a-proteobacteria)]
APDSSAADAAQDPIAAIRAENLTSRQLRMAARIAAMHGIEVESEYEAVHRLRERGIDPFHRSAVGQVLSDEGARSQAAPSPQAPVPLGRGGLPAKRRAREIAPLPPPGPLGRPGPTQLPSREELTEERRAAEIWRIQRDIAKRRRRRLALLMMRLAFFVGLPTLIAGWYYFTQATPLYATNSQFLIQQASSTGAGELGSLFSGTQLATNPDSVSVQSYLNSRDAMNRLDQELGFKRAFQDPSLDPLLRLPQDATNEQAYKLYQQSVKIGYDPTEGVINMEVIAPDPRLSQEFSVALIRYAEGQVDQMTARLREDQMKGAVESYHDAEGRVQEAQNRVQQLQEQMGVLDPMAEGSVVMNQVAQLEGQLSEKRLELGQLQANPRPNQSRVAGVQGDIQRLEQMIADTRAQLTENTGKRASLARISGEIRIAESDLLTRQELLATAAAQMETARIEANKQVRYLSLSVAPVAPDEPTYPRALQNTIVAFLLFAGIYLMLSLTASILREQVST